MEFVDCIDLDDIVCRAGTHTDVVFPEVRVKRDLVPVARMTTRRILGLPRLMQQPLPVFDCPV